MSRAVMGVFEFEDDFLQAAGALKASGYRDLTLMSPIPVHGIEDVLGKRPNRIRYFTLTGAIIGGVAGFAMTVATAVVFILPTGGRPLIPFPPYMVISYEMTILLGVLFTLLGFHVVSGLPAWRDKPYIPQVNVDRFVVMVPHDGDQDLERASSIMKDSGAEDIQTVENA